MRALAIVAVLAAAAPALADGKADRALAAKLFQDGRTLIAAGKIDEACAKFEQSLGLDPAIGTRLNLADCLEKKGEAVAAYRFFDQAAVEAAQTSKEGRQSFARKRADALARKLVKVELHLAEPTTPGLAVILDGVAVAETDWGKPRYLAPGVIGVDVTAPGRTAFHVDVDGKAGASKTIEVPALDRAAAPGDTASGTTAAAGTGAGSVTGAIGDTTTTSGGDGGGSGGDDGPHDRGPNRTMAYVVGGVGVALLGTSLGLGLSARSTFRGAACGDKASPPLPDGVCTIPGQHTTDQARTRADIATGVAIGGAIAVGVGVWLFVRAKPRHAAGDVVVAPAVSDDSVGVVVSFHH